MTQTRLVRHFHITVVSYQYLKSLIYALWLTLVNAILDYTDAANPNML